VRHPPRYASPTCPSCRHAMTARDVDFGAPFRCPACGVHLRVPYAYAAALYCCSIVVSGLLSYSLGFWGYALLFFSAAIWWPVFLMVVRLGQILVPAPLRVHTPVDLTLFPK